MSLITNIREAIRDIISMSVTISGPKWDTETPEDIVSAFLDMMDYFHCPGISGIGIKPFEIRHFSVDDHNMAGYRAPKIWIDGTINMPSNVRSQSLDGNVRWFSKFGGEYEARFGTKSMYGSAQ